jgi:hypothetical protein
LLFLLLAWISLFHFPGKRPGSGKNVAETVALVAFGVSWLTEGLDLKKEIA